MADKIATIFNGVANLGDHGEAFKEVVLFDADTPLSGLMAYAKLYGGTIEITSNTDGNAKMAADSKPITF